MSIKGIEDPAQRDSDIDASSIVDFGDTQIDYGDMQSVIASMTVMKKERFDRLER